MQNIQTPMEVLATNFRNTKHQTNKTLRNVMKNLIAYGGQQNKSPNFLSILNEGREQLINLKRRLSESAKEQNEIFDICKKRIHMDLKMKQEQNFPQNQTQFEITSSIIQFLNFQKRFKQSQSLQLLTSTGELFSIETNLLQLMNNIIIQLKNGNLLPLQIWMNRNSHNLNKKQEKLQFDMFCCVYMEKIASNPYQACQLLQIAVRQKRFVQKHQKQCIQNKLPFYLISSNLNVFTEARRTFWEITAKKFKSIFFEIYKIQNEKLFEKKIAQGISALKTICCCYDDTINQNICPLCEPKINRLMIKIPMLTRQNSSLKCRINGSIMNELNYPLVLPSGQIYSFQGLQETQINDQYYCPVTLTMYRKTDARRIFLA